MKLEEYDEFTKRMEEKFPKMYGGQYGGFCVDQGWWPIIESLSHNIQTHIDWVNEARERLLKDNPYNHKIPDAVEQVVVQQVKEKFGGLRFYYEGGSMYIHAMVRMAESWAAHTCEECGAPGKSGGKGWIKTLCETHRAERDAKYAEYEARTAGIQY